MKYLLVTGLVLLLLAIFLRRLQPFFKMIREFLVTVRQFQMNLNSGAKPEQQTERLVRCEACGTWVPIGRTRRSRAGAVFCSEVCLKGKVARRQSAS